MTTTASPFVIAWTGFSGPAGDVTRGQRIRADHPLVTQAPNLFVADGTPQMEWPAPIDFVIEEEKQRNEALEQERQRRFEQAARKNPMTLDVRLLKSKEDLYAVLDGTPTLIKRGSLVTPDHWLAAEHPDCFEQAKR